MRRDLDVIDKDIEVLTGILNAHRHRRRTGEANADLADRITTYEQLLTKLQTERAEGLRSLGAHSAGSSAS